MIEILGSFKLIFINYWLVLDKSKKLLSLSMTCFILLHKKFHICLFRKKWISANNVMNFMTLLNKKFFFFSLSKGLLQTIA